MIEKLALSSFVVMAHTLENALEALADLYDRREGAWLDEIEATALQAVLDEQLSETEAYVITDFFAWFRQRLQHSSTAETVHFTVTRLHCDDGPSSPPCAKPSQTN